VPALVARDDLARANGRLELARSAAFAAGPALGGALVAWAGADPAFLAAGALSAAAALALHRLPQPPLPSRRERRHLLADLAEGARFAWDHALLRPILLTAVVWNIAWYVLQAVYVVFAVETLGLTAATIGATLAAYGAGMVSGAVLAPRIARRVTFGMLIALGPLTSVAASVVMVLSIRVPGAALPMLAFFLFGAGPILWTIGQTTLRQAVTPAALLGRVSALMTMATTGARPVGAALGAAAGAALGPASCILLAAAGFLVQAVVILASGVPRLRALPVAEAL
jgi:predicted MFS family arabinose efflux permease